MPLISSRVSQSLERPVHRTSLYKIRKSRLAEISPLTLTSDSAGPEGFGKASRNPCLYVRGILHVLRLRSILGTVDKHSRIVMRDHFSLTIFRTTSSTLREEPQAQTRTKSDCLWHHTNSPTCAGRQANWCGTSRLLPASQARNYLILQGVNRLIIEYRSRDRIYILVSKQGEGFFYFPLSENVLFREDD